MYGSAQVKGKAATVCDVADDLRGADKEWRRALASPEDEFGLRGPADAVIAVREAWAKEFEVYHEALEHWCLAARAAAENFTSVDDYIAKKPPTGRI
ncbi:hypothetical protein GCM10012289_48950 [Nonomuraea cavernae]|uniref:Uncharacterized protein n=1 Tax=Nonomuraea cavernae TaxID=2045107 RepID=A0A917Z4N8_9ACTN|nr:hypothetical protein GCM10012289_48950 [Nonomuraea cavernae]